jgi:nucleoside-diphosphate-sugar epimerase
MRANGREGLLTCCIRPSSIFGPGDKLLVPSLVAAARAGKSKVRTDAYLSMLSLVTTDDCMYILTTLIDRFRLSF